MTGIDGYDWGSVGWSNPVPGDPDVVRQISGQLQDLASAVRQQNRLLQSVGTESTGVWSGPAADVFHPTIQKLPPELEQLTTSYGDAGDALDAYWPRHQGAQELAVRALSRAQSAHQAIASAQQQVGSTQTQSTSAAQAYNQAAHPPAGSTPAPGAAATTANLQSQYQAAQGQLSGARAALGSAQGDLAAADAMKQQAVTDWNTAASAAAQLLRVASRAGIHNVHHGFFSSIVHDVTGGLSDAFNGAEHLARDEVGAVVAAVSLVDHVDGMIVHEVGRAADSAMNFAAATATEAYHGAAEFARDNMAVLKTIDTVLDVVSTGLGVLAIVCQPIPGVDAVVDVVSDSVLVVKTADNGLELMGGDSAAGVELVEDGVGLATAGMSNALDGAAEDERSAQSALNAGKSAAEDGADGSGAGQAAAEDAADTSAPATGGTVPGEDAAPGEEGAPTGTRAGADESDDAAPSEDPTADPNADPTADPTADPNDDPTAEPTADPTADSDSGPSAGSGTAGSDPATESATPGRVGTAMGQRSLQTIIQRTSKGTLFEVVDSEGRSTTYLNGFGDALHDLTTGKYATARTLLAIRETNETLGGVGKAYSAVVGADPHEAPLAEKLLVG